MFTKFLNTPWTLTKEEELQAQGFITLGERYLSTMPKKMREYAERELTEEDNAPAIDFISEVNAGVLLERRVGLYFDMEDDWAAEHYAQELWDAGVFEVTYSFPDTARDNVFTTTKGGTSTYGQKMSYRMLYEFLCRWYNGGNYFIDDYFKGPFQHSAGFYDLMTLQEDMRKDMAEELFHMKQEAQGKNARLQNRAGQFRSRSDIRKQDIYADYRRSFEKYGWDTFNVWRDVKYKKAEEDLAQEIADDIIHCLQTGGMPLLKQSVTPATARERAMFADLDPKQYFYASGRLINSIQIFVNVDKGE